MCGCDYEPRSWRKCVYVTIRLPVGKKGCLWGEDGGGGRRRPFGEEWRVRVTKTAVEAWLALATSGAVKDEWPGMTRAK